MGDRTGLLSRSSGGSRHSRLAAARCLLAPALAVLAALSALALLALLARSLLSRASRSMIARFISGPKSTVFTVFEALLAPNSSFSTTLGVEKHVFLRIG